MTSLKDKVLKAAQYIKKNISLGPQIGLVLGTGLGALANDIESPEKLEYKNIPYFPASTVKFHAGNLIAGTLQGKNVFVMQGRFHYYEGYPLQQITLPIRVFYELGVRTLILSNAAGGIKEHLVPGSLTIINDHINLMGNNPLIGPFDEFLGERFPDMSEPYSTRLQKLAHQQASQLDIELFDTVYAAVSGPSFETAAEIKMLQILGADSVGMSVVPEVLVARQLGMDVLALTAITDQSLPDEMNPISHVEVSKVANNITPKFSNLVKEIIKNL